MIGIVHVGMSTPWGRATYVEPLANGVGLVSTPSHGGIKVDPIRNQRIHPAWRRSGGWYEEDCEALIVLYTFDDVAPKVSREEIVIPQLRHWFPEESKIALPQ
jgi:hypothetical protein